MNLLALYPFYCVSVTLNVSSYLLSCLWYLQYQTLQSQYSLTSVNEDKPVLFLPVSLIYR
jgi:hypothetical protein